MRFLIGDYDPHGDGLDDSALESFIPVDQDVDETPLRDAVRAAIDKAFRGRTTPEEFQQEIAMIGFAVLQPPTSGRMEPLRLFPGDFVGVDANGRLKIADDDLLDLTVAEMVRALDDGYYGTSQHSLLITRYHAWGGNGFLAADLLEWMVHQVPGILFGFGATKGLERLTGSRERKLRKVAEGWAARRLENPYQLRSWIESKQSWSPAEVATRLELPEASAEALLVELGYERTDRGGYVLHSSLDALRKRDLWILHETQEFADYLDDLGPE